MRAFCLLVGFALAVPTSSVRASAGTAALLVVIALVMSLWAAATGPLTSALYEYALLAEAAAVIVVLVVGSPDLNAYIIYVTAAPLLAGLRGGILPACGVVIVQSLTLMVVYALQDAPSLALLALDALWLMTGFAAALLGAWIRQLRLARDEDMTPYASAHRLLGQLRTIARELPAGLDIDVVSEKVLATTLDALRGGRAALFLTQQSGPPKVVASRSVDGSEPMSSTQPAVAMAMRLMRAVQEPQPTGSRRHCDQICLPLIVDGRPIGAVVVDGSGPVSPEVIDDVQLTLNNEALALESALLFGDVRAVATVEERRRLAREIHDGVAQEIASLAYLVDDLVREKCDHDHQGGLVDLRQELTRVVTELRLSIFDLRSGVSTQAGLGSVLGDYVREVGTGSDFAVHVSLEESPQRLRLDIETELLRIAQEAVTNARRHANASNLWVTCRVLPPFAEIRVEDDGVGHATARADHYGLSIMGERADRINATLTISERPHGGTSVAAVLEAEPARPHGRHGTGGGAHDLHRAAC